jgi:hypothetical protein
MSYKLHGGPLLIGIRKQEEVLTLSRGSYSNGVLDFRDEIDRKSPP